MLVYIIFHCDQWQTYDSMRLIGVATKSKLKHVLRVIKKELHYSKEDMETYIYIEEATTNDIEGMNI